MLEEEIEAIKHRLVELQIEHRDLDVVIHRLIEEGHPDELQLRRLKKRKLQLKDAIFKLECMLVPDTLA